MIAYFARHPTAANLMMVAFLILGLAALPDLKRETFPDLPTEDVQVSVVWPGASAEQAEDGLCRRLEDALEGIQDLSEMTCTATEGLATAVATLREGTDPQVFLDDITAEVEAIDDFPDDIEKPRVVLLDRTDFVAAVAIAGPMPATDLRRYALEVRQRMHRFGGLPLVEIQGFSDRQIRIEIPAPVLRGLGLSLAQLAGTIGAQSLDIPAGTLETAGGDLLIRIDDQRLTPDAFRDLVVVADDRGGEVRLGDIATITDTFEDPENAILYNGERAALLRITKTRADDSLEVMAALTAFLEQERAQAPPQVTLAVTADISSVVRDRLTMLLNNGLQGLVLVFLAMWLFFGLRYSFWVAMGLPVSFTGALFLMQVMGYSLNMITMVALLIAVGLLMDDAIVIAENIARRLGRGDPPMTAAITGTREVAPGVVSSFLTTICLFGALAFLQGHMGAILGVLPVVLVTVLAVSLIEAFLILPHHLAHSLEAAGAGAGAGTGTGAGGNDASSVAAPPGDRQQETEDRAMGKGRLLRRFDAAFGRFRDAFVDRVVARTLRWRGLTIGGLILLVLLSVALVPAGWLKMRAFPDVEGDVLEARILMPQGTPLARTQAVVDHLVAAARAINADFRPDQPGGADVVEAITVQLSRNQDAGESGPHLATVTLDLLSAERRNAPMSAVIEAWRKAAGPVPDVVAIHYTQRQIGPAGKAIEVRLSGDDLDELAAASQALQSWLSGYPGVHDLYDDLRPGKPEAVLSLRADAAGLGLTTRDVADQVRAAFQGMTVDEPRVGLESYEVDVRLSARDRASLADLDDFSLYSAQGEAIPLNAVAEVTETRGWARISRVDGRRTVTLSGDVDGRIANSAEILGHTRAVFLPQLLDRYPGVQVSLQGEAKEGAKTGSSIRRNFLIGLIGIFLLLSFQFRSMIEPVTVMAAIPLGLVGAFWGHLAQGLELSMPSMVGLASLAGVVVNDSILLVQFMKARIAEGADPETAALEATRDRFRPIILTSLTTVLGMSPLLLETSLQAQIMQPLATSLAFGLGSATILALFLVPCLYVALCDLGLVRRPAPLAPPPAAAATPAD